MSEMKASSPLGTVPEQTAMTNNGTNPCDPITHALCDKAPASIVTRGTRRESVSERAMQGPQHRGHIKYFCRQRGHGFITPTNGGDDMFVHITDIIGEYVPHEGDEVVYKECTSPPKFDHVQAIHVTIKNLAPGRHERWSEQPMTHKHPHPAPNIPAMRNPDPHLTPSTPDE